MTVPHYPVLCRCGGPATHKVAARWSDGATVEWKTYSLCCATCLDAEVASAHARRAACKLTHGETLDELRAFEHAGPGVGPPRSH